MFRLLYKTLLVSIISGSMSTMNMMAFAQSGSNMQKAQTPQGLSRDSNGVYKKTDSHKFEKVDDPDMLASITMLATGFIAARLMIKYKPVTTDMMIAATAGALFIAGEVMSNMDFKKKMDDKTIEVTKSSDGKIDQAQIDRLNDLKQSYEEAKKTTNTKRTMQLAAATAFAGAAALAGYMNWEEYSAVTACMTAAKASLACPVAGPMVIEGMEVLNTIRQTPGPTRINGVSANTAKINVETALTSLGPACSSVVPASSVLVAAGAATMTACKSALAIESINQTIKMTPPGLDDIGAIDNFNKFFNKHLYTEIEHKKKISSSFLKTIASVMNVVFPRAEANWLPLLGLTSGALVGVFGAEYLGLATETDFFMLSPFNRVIAWGTLATLSYLAASASEDQMNKIDGNIKRIDQILTEMNALQNGIKTNTIQEQQIRMAGFNANNTTDIQINPNASVKTDCVGSSGNSNCKTLTDQLKAMPGFSDLPDSFKGIATQSAKLGDGLSGTNVISGSTLSAASNLANQNHAISKLLKNVQTKLNDQLAANGKPKVDFDKEEKKLLDRLNGVTEKSLKSKGMSAGAFLASTGMSPISHSGAKPAIAAAVASKKSSPTSLGGGSAGPGPAKKDKAFDFDFKESTGDANFAAGGGADSAKDVKYDIGQNDINTDKSESIFQMISNRYLKSGYPKLLEEIPVKN